MEASHSFEISNAFYTTAVAVNHITRVFIARYRRAWKDGISSKYTSTEIDFPQSRHRNAGMKFED